MGKKLYIGNCDFNLDEATLQTFIESKGVKVSAVQIIRDRDTGRSRGFGFAELADSQSPQQAISASTARK